MCGGIQAPYSNAPLPDTPKENHEEVWGCLIDPAPYTTTPLPKTSNIKGKLPFWKMKS